MIKVKTMVNILFLIFAGSKKQLMDEKKYPKGHFMGIGLGIGLAVGFVAGFLIGKFTGSRDLGLSVGPAAGLILGALAGLLLENKNKHRRRQMTVIERRRGRKIIFLTIIAFAMLVFVSVMLLLKTTSQ